MTKEQSSTGLKTHVASTLAYLGVWVSGIVFVIIETRDRVVRFHAMQSIILFAGFHVLLLVLAAVRVFFGSPAWGGTMAPLTITFLILQNLVVAFSIALWILMMVKSYREEQLILPLVGELAMWVLQRMNGVAGTGSYLPEYASKKRHKAGRDESGFRLSESHAGRVAASVAAIVWSLFILILFNLYPDYVAYYAASGSDGVDQLLRYPILTGELSGVLPVLNATLALTIVGHIVALVVDRYPVREAVEVLTHVMGMVTALVFLKVFPFYFGDLPFGDIVESIPTFVVVVLVITAVANGIEALTRLVRLVTYAANGRAGL